MILFRDQSNFNRWFAIEFDISWYYQTTLFRTLQTCRFATNSIRFVRDLVWSGQLQGQKVGKACVKKGPPCDPTLWLAQTLDRCTS